MEKKHTGQRPKRACQLRMDEKEPSTRDTATGQSQRVRETGPEGEQRPLIRLLLRQLHQPLAPDSVIHLETPLPRRPPDILALPPPVFLQGDQNRQPPGIDTRLGSGAKHVWPASITWDTSGELGVTRALPPARPERWRRPAARCRRGRAGPGGPGGPGGGGPHHAERPPKNRRPLRTPPQPRLRARAGPFQRP